MTQVMDLQFKPEVLARYSLPVIGYPISETALVESLQNGGELPLAAMLYGLQRKAAAGGVDWRSLEPAMDRLAQLLAPDNEADATTVAGDEWWLELGPVDLANKILTIQRDGALIAGVAPREDGRLRIAVFRPLDAKAAHMLMRVGKLPGADGKVSNCESNWELALDASAGLGQVYSANAGLAYCSYWQYGLGVDADGDRVD